MMKKIKKYMIRTLVVLLLLLVAAGAFFTLVPYSDGMRAGQVIKLTKKGVIFKTWEGELNLLLMPSTNTQGTLTPNVWNFSVLNKDIANKVMQASATGERLELYYKERYFKFPWQGDTRYFVYEVKSAPPPAQQVPSTR
ncbi:MAG TPA: hypothetical protein PKM27_05040 [Saprospiraceae bacterium]|nr:hypothetical protein [Saprospiraceae bacterium]HNT20758.1 hypothetical protein [Saprospiraceae bacterium]